MKLRKILLHNFRPYCGTHEINLEPIDGNGLVVIFGENMSGKTGLFLALNWCLYGKASGRRGEPIHTYLPGSDENNFLINAKAIDDGDYTMHVQLEWEHDGEIWVLDRKETCEGDPLSGDSFQSWVSLKIGSGVKHRQEIEQRVNQLLHHQAAQFYFFDGELLSQYERWLENPTERETRVRRAVETTVGIAALRLCDEMQVVAREAEEAQTKLVRKEKREERLVLEAEERENARRDLRKEIDEYEQTIVRLERESTQIEGVHGALADFAQQQGRLAEIERSIDHETEREERANAAMRNLVKDFYWIPLAVATDTLSRSLTDELQRSVEGSDQGVRSTLLDASLDASRCEICGQQLDGTSRKHIGRQRQDLALEGYKRGDVATVKELVWRISELDRFKVDGRIEYLEKLEEDRMNARGDSYSYEEEAEAIRNEHSDRPRGDREREMANLKKIADRIGKTRESLARAEAEVLTIDQEIASLRTKINRIEIDPRVLRKAQAARVAADATKSALNQFREVARKTVEIEASGIFRKLVSEPSYAGIRIDEDYRVVPVDDQGEVLPIPSAGGQQLLTLALVGGLNAAAVHDAPVVMDTPAGRIDKDNRRRILHWIDGLDQQTILMVHSGEYTPEEIETLNISVARAYKIEKTSAKTSEIRVAGE